MRELHLICNAHIDPVWQWDWEEGLGTTVSTFKQAADFCDEYDYVFCHNESILYEYVEKDGALRAKAQGWLSVCDALRRGGRDNRGNGA